MPAYSPNMDTPTEDRIRLLPSVMATGWSAKLDAPWSLIRDISIWECAWKPNPDQGCVQKWLVATSSLPVESGRRRPRYKVRRCLPTQEAPDVAERHLEHSLKSGATAAGHVRGNYDLG
jgi:hypothetical protein